MLRLFRDSIFNPKNIIAYRAKKWWYVIVYILILSALFGLTTMSEPMSYNPINYSNRQTIIDAFKGTDSKITDGVYSSSEEMINVEFDGYIIGFFNSKDSMKAKRNEYPDFAICGDAIYTVNSTMLFGSTTQEIKKISAFASELQNVNLGTLTATDPMFKGIEDAFNNAKPILVIQYFFQGLIYGAINCLGYALIGYCFIMVFLRAGRYMKKSQLFKMLVFSSTAMTIVECLNMMLPIPLIIYWILLLVSFIPMYILEREIMMRIRIKVMGETFMDNQSILDKINNTLKNRDKDDKSDINVDYDSDDYDNDNDRDNEEDD